ncbi:flagellar biosynthesis anti-sigma factor FlgM [Izhakiella australiensis]|uniref:Negative regulator of flagellin synthesis n=1 Tax=Izhakiella australiensis TaxID=1926881 RepID=A0A1S8YI51_9GAMM|nr:flagellar biosynthesis anti-sigma factor FlgM [Izhakiella australiensis]OON38751.1 flagellar biosynthesis anti-sigma factor FlgM [Izhakiella australiensis]
MKIITGLLAPVPTRQAPRQESEATSAAEQPTAAPRQSQNPGSALLAAQRLLRETPEVDAQNVTACKAAIEAGTFKIDTDELARAMMDFHRHGY